MKDEKFTNDELKAFENMTLEEFDNLDDTHEFSDLYEKKKAKMLDTYDIHRTAPKKRTNYYAWGGIAAAVLIAVIAAPTLLNGLNSKSTSDKSMSASDSVMEVADNTENKTEDDSANFSKVQEYASDAFEDDADLKETEEEYNETEIGVDTTEEATIEDENDKEVIGESGTDEIVIDEADDESSIDEASSSEASTAGEIAFGYLAENQKELAEEVQATEDYLEVATTDTVSELPEDVTKVNEDSAEFETESFTVVSFEISGGKLLVYLDENRVVCGFNKTK